MILANLRPPTLIQLFPKMAALTSPRATWLLSGFRMEEQARLEKRLIRCGGRLEWAENAGQWSAFAVYFEFPPEWTMAGR